MAGKLGKFQMVGFQHWKGLTKENHLGSIFQLAPQKATNLMVQLLAYYRGKTLDTFLNQFPTREFEDDNEYYWDVIGSSRRNIPLVEARDENGTIVTRDKGMIGVGTAPFYLVFPEDWFADGEYIVGNLNEIYQFRILGDPRIEGTNAVYKVELAGGNTAGVPAERLLAGERFSVEAAFVEKELSRKVGDVRFTSPVSMRNEWSIVRIQHKVPGSMLNKKLAVGIPIVNETEGRYTKSVATMWMHNVDWEVEQQFSEYKNNALAFGRSNRNANGEYMNFGKSGNVIKTGAGLFEQMEVANTMYYNTFSLKLLEDALYELSASKLNFGDRYFLIKTGERGAIQFHKEVLKTVSGWTQFVLDNSSVGVIQKTQSKLHQNSLSAGFQFVEYKAPNGVRVKIDVDPFYDDPVRNKILHPNGGVAFSYRYDIMYIGTMDQPNIFKCKIKGDNEYKAPNGVRVKIDVDPFYDDPVRNKILHPNGGVAFSYRYDIMYIGTMDQPNIFKCKIKGDNEYRGYQWGLRNPFTGQKGNPYMSFDEDSAVIHRMATLGICVLDPTRTMSLIPAILQG